MKKRILSIVALLPLTTAVYSGLNQWDEKMAIAVLAIDTQTRAEACQALAVVGGPDSVPALSWVLDDPQLASYARTALEVMDHPSASQALLDALERLEGRNLVGVVTSLGVRGEEKAVPALQALVEDPKRGAAKAALIALARIGNEAALDTLTKSLQDNSADLRLDAAHAALLGAELLQKNGQPRQANALRKAVSSAQIPEYIKKAASS